MNKYIVIVFSSAEMILNIAFKVWRLHVQMLHVLIWWNPGNRTQMDLLQSWKH